MGLFKSLGQVLGGLVALVGQKAFLDSRSCGVSLTEAAMPSRLFTTALQCESNHPRANTTYGASVPPYGGVDISLDLTPSPAIPTETIYIHSARPYSSSDTPSPPEVPGYLSLLASAAEVAWATFVEFYLEPALYALFVTVVLPLLVRIWRVVNPPIVYRETIAPWIPCLRHLAILACILALQLYRCCAFIAVFLASVLMAVWRHFAVSEVKGRQTPGETGKPTPTISDEELTHLRFVIESQATEIQNLNVRLAVDEADKQKDIKARVMKRFQTLKSANDKDIAQQRRDFSRFTDDMGAIHQRELDVMKARYDESAEIAAEEKETVLAELNERINALEAQVEKQQELSESNVQETPHDAGAPEAEATKPLDELVAEAVEKRNQEWEAMMAREKPKLEKVFADLREELANAEETSQAEKDHAVNAKSKTNKALKNVTHWRTQAKDLTRQLQVSRDSATQWQDRAQNLSPQLQDSQNTVELWRQQAQNLQTQLTTAQQQGQTSQSQLATAQQQGQTLQAQLATAQQQEQTLQAQVATARQDGQTLRTQLEAERQRAEGLTSQLQESQRTVNELRTKATDAESKLKKLQDKAPKEAEKGQRSKVADAEARLGQAQTGENTQRQRAENAERELAKSRRDLAWMKQQADSMRGPSTAQSHSPSPYSASPFSPSPFSPSPFSPSPFAPSPHTPSPYTPIRPPPIVGSSSTGIPGMPATAPLYNPTSLPIFGGRGVGTTQVIPGTSGSILPSMEELGAELADDVARHLAASTRSSATTQSTPSAPPRSLSSLPGPSNSSAPSVPGFRGPVTSLPSATSGQGLTTSPFNPSAGPFNAAAPSSIPTMGFPDDGDTDSSSSLSSPPPLDDEAEEEEDALSDNGLNDLSYFADPYAFDPSDTIWDNLDPNIAPAEVMAGRRVAMPRARRGVASAGVHEANETDSLQTAARLVARVQRMAERGRAEGEAWAFPSAHAVAANTAGAGVVESAAVEGAGYGGDGGEATAVDGGVDAMTDGEAVLIPTGPSGGVDESSFGLALSDPELRRTLLGLR